MPTKDNSKKLGWFLCWAVVFADIGTSLYYVPGILYGQVGNLTGLFILMTSVVLILLGLKYVDISSRYKEGGGVVTVASESFGPWIGALGGMFITVSYYLTVAISAISGFAYLDSLLDFGPAFVVILAVIGTIFLGILNVIGIQESAKVTAIMAVIAFVIDLILIVLISTQIGPEGWDIVTSSLTNFSGMTPWTLLVGFSGAFLAFSGLESISQLSPAMQTPRTKTAGIAMALVIITMLLTSPLLSLFSTNLLTAKINTTSSETILESVGKIKTREEELKNIQDPIEREALENEIKEGKSNSERFMSELGAQYGGPLLKIGVVITASTLLMFAANTAIIGAYHVFISLSRLKFLPRFLEKHNKQFDTPHWAVLLAVVPPIIIIFLTKGNVSLLGELYAFGLLGAFGLSSVGLDIVRWKESRKLSPGFLIGIATSLLVVTAWGVNLYSKPLATIFGGCVSMAGMFIAFLVNKLSKDEEKIFIEIAKDERLPEKQILVPFFDEFDSKLFEYAAKYAQANKKEIIVAYIRDFSDILQTVNEDIKTDQEASKYLESAKKIMKKNGIKTHLVYKTSTSTAQTINDLRSKANPELTILSPHKQSLILDFLKGDIIKKILNYKNGNILIYTGSN